MKIESCVKVRLRFSGLIDDENVFVGDDRDWYAYWRLLFKPITREDIESFEKNYKGLFSFAFSMH